MVALLIEPPSPRSDGPGKPAGATLLGVIRHLATTPATTGVVQFLRPSGLSAGALVMDGGRICLVRAAGARSRLGERLAEAEPGLRRKVANAVERAQRWGQPLGETLIGEGVPLETVRHALRSQAVEGLLALVSRLGGAGEMEVRVQPLAGKFDPRLTFSVQEIYAQALDALQPKLGAPWEIGREFSPELELVVALEDEGGGSWVPRRMAASPEVTLDAVIAAWRMATTFARPPALAAAGVQPTVIAVGSPSWGCLIVTDGPTCVLMVGASATVRARILQKIQADRP